VFRQLDYQEHVLAAIDTLLDLLKARKAEADQIAEIAKGRPDLRFMVPDFAKEA
jgi:type III restriction enzyme